MKYICGMCGNIFTSSDDDFSRRCPDCDSDSRDHAPEVFDYIEPCDIGD